MVKESYVIEAGERPFLSMSGFKPRKKVGLIINGIINKYPYSFEMIADLLVQRGYDYITAIREASSHSLCRDTVRHYKTAVEGKLEELSRELTPDDVLFTAILGPSVRAQGIISIPLHGGENFTAYELRDALSRIPAHHAIHFVSPNEYAGELARTLATAKHPEIESRHIAIAPTTPNVAKTLFPHKQEGAHEVATPFHQGFFDLEDRPTLEARFQVAAVYQRQHRAEAAYMRYGTIEPREVAFLR